MPTQSTRTPVASGSRVPVWPIFLIPSFFEYLLTISLLVKFFSLPIQILINDNYELTKIVATPKEKLDLLNLYKSLIGMYQTNTFIDIYNDYENTLRENKELKLR